MVKEEEQLDKLALDLFAKYPIDFTPRFPWLLIRILPRTQRIGMIWAPDYLSQNKPVHEGIVLKVYEPFKKYWTEKSVEKEREIKSDYVVGDHVLYQHSTGFPAFGLLDEKWYRLVPDYKIGDHTAIFGKLNYEKESAEEQLNNLLGTDKAFRILQDFDVVPKGKYSRTTSGR